MLYIVATPIGNLQDISFRAIETLKKSDAIICEDTRRANILLSHFGIKKPLLILNDFNESKEYLKVLEKLEKGFLQELKEKVKSGITLKSTADISGGFTISFDSGKSHLDFTDHALAEYLSNYLKPKLKEILDSSVT